MPVVGDNLVGTLPDGIFVLVLFRLQLLLPESGAILEAGRQREPRRCRKGPGAGVARPDQAL